jgi:hypothetical protein
MRRIATLVACALALAVAPVAAAQEKSAVKPGFALAPGTAKILLFRPRIRVGAQSTGGMFEPNADWTAQARDNLGQVLAATQQRLGNQVIDAGEPVGPAAERLASYQSLFSVVAESVIQYQFFKGNRLPTKKRKGEFAWTLGPGVAELGKNTGANYALFLWTDDAYGSTGRKVLQVFAAMARVPVQAGVHKGYAGLVDLKTGDLVWLNADMQMGGDVRTPDGAQKRMGQLLEDFPGSTGTAAAVPAAGQ